MKKRIIRQRARILQFVFVGSLCILFTKSLFAAPLISTDIVISQVYGGAGCSTANCSTYKNDFIELFNRGNVAVSLNGWSVQYASATGTGVWQVTPLPNTSLEPGKYFLIQEAGNSNGVLSLPTPDATDTIPMSATAGKVAVLDTTSALNGACPSSANIKDVVGYGSSANCYEASPTSAPSTTNAAIRYSNGCAETDDNAKDFFVGTPTPRNTSSLSNVCSNFAPFAGAVLITAVFYNGYQTNDDDEAVEIMNVTASAIDLRNWQLSDNEGAVTFPNGASLAAGARAWLAKKATAFRTTFGYLPNYEYGGDSGAGVSQMTGAAPSLTNTGDEVVLRDGAGSIDDAMVYGTGNTLQTGWTGAAVQLYNTSSFSSNQVLFRKADETTGFPIPDTNAEKDWAASTTAGATLFGPVREGDLYGKKPMVPGWSTGFIKPSQTLTDNWVTLKSTESASFSVFVAPDNIYENYLSAINAATTSIYIETYELTNKNIIAALVSKASSGITVKMLLEGECASPEQETFWSAKQIADAGGQVYFMSNSSPHRDRYDCLHAKVTIVDAGTANQQLLSGSENLSCNGMPPDDKSDGTKGHRGYYFKTNAPQVVARFLSIFNLDLDVNGDDVVPYGTAPYIWDSATVPSDCAMDANFYSIRKASPLNISGTFNFEVVQCPDNCLKYNESLIRMVRRAGAGDVLLVEQLYEYKYWGGTSPTQDPNPRLEAYIEAARRGARVRILLDARYSCGSTATDNDQTVLYVNQIATSESLDLQARLADFCNGLYPAGQGIHAKLVMVYRPSANTAWIHIGSINGSENSSKFNREMALQVESRSAYCYLYDVFDFDWRKSGGTSFGVGCGLLLPFIAK